LEKLRKRAAKEKVATTSNAEGQADGEKKDGDAGEEGGALHRPPPRPTTSYKEGGFNEFGKEDKGKEVEGEGERRRDKERSKSRKRKKSDKGKEKEIDSGKQDRQEKESEKEKPIPWSVTRAPKDYDFFSLVDFISQCLMTDARWISLVPEEDKRLKVWEGL
jgi:hypothetical protein